LRVESNLLANHRDLGSLHPRKNVFSARWAVNLISTALFSDALKKRFLN
jgi:hypothetical protein